MGRFFQDEGITFVKEISGTKANHWLNAIIFESKKDRDFFLKITNKNNIMTRPIWKICLNYQCIKTVKKILLKILYGFKIELLIFPQVFHKYTI